MTTFRTLHDRILVQRDEPVKKIGLIEIPDSAQELRFSGTIVAVGIDRDVKVGEHVFFTKNVGQEAQLDDERRLIIAEHDILAVVDPSTELGLRAIGTRVLLLPSKLDEKRGLIIMPPTAAKNAREKEQLIVGKILAMGTGMRTKSGGRWPMSDVKIGQEVLFYQPYVSEIVFEGTTYVSVTDNALRAVFEEEVA